MGSLTTTTTWCPSSSQLRFAFNCRRSSPVSVRVRWLGFQKLDHRFRRGIRIYSVAGTGNSGNGNDVNSDSEVERRRSGNSSWMNLNNLTDGFAGWSGAQQSDDDSKSKQSLGGILGVGLSGVLLVAGLTFAALTIGRKSTSKPNQQMEPLSAQQEVSLASDDHDEISEEKKNNGIDDKQEISNEESNTGIDTDSSLYVDNNEAVKSRFSDNLDSKNTSNDDVMTSDDTVQQELQNEAAEEGTPVVSEDTSKPPKSENEGDSLVAPSSGSKDDIFSEGRADSLIPGKPENIDFPGESNPSLFDATTINLTSDHQQSVSGLQELESSNTSLDSSPNDSISLTISASSQFESASLPNIMHEDEKEERSSFSGKEGSEQTLETSAERENLSPDVHNLNKSASTGSDPIPAVVYSLVNEQVSSGYNDNTVSELSFHSTNSGNFFTSAGVPAPSLVSAAQAPGKVLVPAVVDQVQGQALAALQVLKVIEADVQPGDLCTRREYARWLVSASSALSRNTISKVYPAMYIENVSELAFDDITPDDPDFPSIQGLAEAGLISSKLSRRDMQSSIDEEQNPLYFSPESSLSRQDLVSWKMALERRQLPVVNRKAMEQLSGFIDIDKIHPDAWPALAADLATGEQGIIALAFGYTRLFQPDKPVTKAQAAVALATGEASDIVNEELARIEAESMAEKAVAAHSDLVAQVEKDINASFEKELILEREKIDTIERLAEETKQELERLKAQREEENLTLMKERAAVDSEMEVLSRLRREMEEQLQAVMSNKVEISFEKERVNKLREDAENENKEIARLQYELEVERKALSMARAWAEDEAKRAREQAKVLEEARGRWERQGIKVVVDDDMREEADAAVTWVSASKEFSVEGTVDRAENLVDKLKKMADVVTGKSKATINLIIQKISLLISVLKDWALKASEQAGESKDAILSKMSSSLHELQQSSAQLTSAAKEGIKRIAVDCKGGVERLTQKFKAA